MLCREVFASWFHNPLITKGVGEFPANRDS